MFDKLAEDIYAVVEQYAQYQHYLDFMYIHNVTAPDHPPSPSDHISDTMARFVGKKKTHCVCDV